jgi:hypothetical protein
MKGWGRTPETGCDMRLADQKIEVIINTYPYKKQKD